MPVTCYWQWGINNSLLSSTEEEIIISISGGHGKLCKWGSSKLNSEDLTGVKKKINPKGKESYARKKKNIKKNSI